MKLDDPRWPQLIGYWPAGFFFSYHARRQTFLFRIVYYTVRDERAPDGFDQTR